MTKLLYLYDSYQFTSEAIITATGHDEKGHYVLLNQTVFYPQGGGQPADHGRIKADGFDVPVSFVRQVEGEIRHYSSITPSAEWMRAKVECQLNQERRILNARYHTAAHLLGNVVEQLCPELKAIKGHSFPGEAYVEFSKSQEVSLLAVEEVLAEAITSNMTTRTFEMLPEEFERQFYRMPYQMPSNKGFRIMQIGDYAPVPCGGTHVACTKEIGGMKIRKISTKNDRTRISYEVI